MIYVSRMWNKGTSKIRASELSMTLDLEEITDTVADHIREGIPGQRLLTTQAARCANLKPPCNLSFKNKGRGTIMVETINSYFIKYMYVVSIHLVISVYKIVFHQSGSDICLRKPGEMGRFMRKGRNLSGFRSFHVKMVLWGPSRSRLNISLALL